MSTEEDGHTLTRKQLRELRLTGSTPVVSGEEAAAARAAQSEKPSDRPEDAAPADAGGRSAAAGSDSAEPSWPSVTVPASSAPLTRRAARAQERGRTGSVPVVAVEQQSAAEEPFAQEPVVEEPVVEEPVVEEPVVEELVVEEPVVDAPVGSLAQAGGSAEADEAETDAEPDRPMVGAAFGIGVKRAPSGQGIPTAFDDLLETGSAGSHKTASTLIFTPSPGAGSLSGPVASTGELLITGTYALPDGMGSQGHALGTTDGKDVDAVLIDGELAPSSSPTPIAASSAISTSKPAGEVIRPPVPDKGSKLTLTLAIVAGGLALALAAALIIAFTTGVLR